MHFYNILTVAAETVPNNYTHVEICNIRQLCEHFQRTSKGVRMVKLIRQTGVWPSTLIKHIQVIAPATVAGPGFPGPPVSPVKQTGMPFVL